MSCTIRSAENQLRKFLPLSLNINIDQFLRGHFYYPSDNVAENPGDLEGMEAHGGMVRAARYVFAELRDKNILNKAFSYFDGYTVRAP